MSHNLYDEYAAVGSCCCVDAVDCVGRNVYCTLEAECHVCSPDIIVDRVLSTRIGAGAAEAILDGEYGIMIGVVNGKIKRVPLEECAGKLKMVSPKDQTVKAAKQIGISFGD